jgi:hypothetical protein
MCTTLLSATRDGEYHTITNFITTILQTLATFIRNNPTHKTALVLRDEMDKELVATNNNNNNKIIITQIRRMVRVCPSLLSSNDILALHDYTNSAVQRTSVMTLLTIQHCSL